MTANETLAREIVREYLDRMGWAQIDDCSHLDTAIAAALDAAEARGRTAVRIGSVDVAYEQGRAAGLEEIAEFVVPSLDYLKGQLLPGGETDMSPELVDEIDAVIERIRALIQPGKAGE
jgi:hypothetical protein